MAERRYFWSEELEGSKSTAEAMITVSVSESHYFLFTFQHLRNLSKGLQERHGHSIP